jgi:hypothetical protein
MKITTLTSEHVLRYLLASEGLELSYGPIRTSWPIFKQFLELPSEASNDVGSYQVGHGDEGAPRFVQAAFTRQLTDSAGGYGTYSRSTILVYSWDFTEPFVIEPAEIWSSDYPSLADFFNAVESHISFAALADLPPEQASVQVDEPAADSEPESGVA